MPSATHVEEQIDEQNYKSTPEIWKPKFDEQNQK